MKHILSLLLLTLYYWAAFGTGLFILLLPVVAFCGSLADLPLCYRQGVAAGLLGLAGWTAQRELRELREAAAWDRAVRD